MVTKTKKTGEDHAKKAREEIQKMKTMAEKDMKSFEPVQSFEIPTECEDKEGESTRVLIIDTDKEGILGLFMEHGQPFSFGHDGQIKEDNKKLSLYFNFMSNIDLTNSDNLKAIGWNTLPKAREVVRNFFMLRLVLDLNVVQETGK